MIPTTRFLALAVAGSMETMAYAFFPLSRHSLANAPSSQKSFYSRTAVNMSEEDIFYALGTALGQQTAQYQNLLSSAEKEEVVKGITDVWLQNPLRISPDDYVDEVNQMLEERSQLQAKDTEEKSKTFLQSAANEEGAFQTPSGLVVKVLKEGYGEAPKETDKVNVHYHGTLMSGEVFDSSVLRGSPISFPLNGVIKGWTEGLQHMKVGGKAKLTIPSQLAYGTKGAGSVPPNSLLIFEVELLNIE